MIWYEHLAWCCSLIDERFFSVGAGAPEIGIPNKHSVTTGQSGGELIGVCGAKLYARERATTEALKQKAGPFFRILRSHFWGRNLDLETKSLLCLEIRVKPTRPVQLCSRFVFNTVMFIFP